MIQRDVALRDTLRTSRATVFPRLQISDPCSIPAYLVIVMPLLQAKTTTTTYLMFSI